LADLQRSGLTEGTIAAAGIRSLPPSEWARYLPAGLAAHILSAYLLPYPGIECFYRVKLFPPVPNGDGHAMRYYQPAGSAPQLYLPPRARAALADPAVPLHWTEGEKKALRADQAGLVCIGLGGLWNWSAGGLPISGLDAIDHVDRVEVLIPDSDVWTRPDLLQAVYALGKELEGRGAAVSVLKLPAGPAGAKVGLDDFLCSRPAEDLEALPRLLLKHAAFSRAAEWWKGWRARRGAANGDAADAVALLERGETVRPLHPAQDVLGGTLWYGVPAGDALVCLTSERVVCKASALPRGLVLRHTELTSSTVSRDAALAWMGGAASGSVADALDQLAAFFARFVVFADARTPLLLAAWTLGTWCYRAFRVFPYLSLRSPEKRCGKTRVLGLLARLSFNASPVTAHPTEAQLYRAAARSGGAQLLDEVETLRGDKERFDALIAVLNVGFERGGVVTRLEKRGERFVEVAHEVYAPRALAGIAALKETLADRSIPVFMTRKRRDESVARLTGAIEGEAAALRDRCALACLARIGDILTANEQTPALLEREQVDDRATDLWAPLVALGLVGDAEDGGDRGATLLGLARELGGLRDADGEDGQTARLVEALTTIRQERGPELSPEDLRAALAGRPGWEWVKTTRRLAGLLSPLGLFREQRREGGRRLRVYRLDAARLADLTARYGTSLDGQPDGQPEPEEYRAPVPPAHNPVTR
jgi:hypothetical protein